MGQRRRKRAGLILLTFVSSMPKPEPDFVCFHECRSYPVIPIVMLRDYHR